ncbi:MAG: hypothetical protein GY696_05430 [Gammaproteobacteria bacterium]|nr:hypothetical protein [Gammaproteobacteria bacterium]
MKHSLPQEELNSKLAGLQCLTVTGTDEPNKFWSFFGEKRSYSAAMNVFITVLKYANMWMRVCATRK